jgi:hypothetical protein
MHRPAATNFEDELGLALSGTGLRRTGKSCQRSFKE